MRRWKGKIKTSAVPLLRFKEKKKNLYEIKRSVCTIDKYAHLFHKSVNATRTTTKIKLSNPIVVPIAIPVKCDDRFIIRFVLKKIRQYSKSI